MSTNIVEMKSPVLRSTGRGLVERALLDQTVAAVVFAALLFAAVAFVAARATIAAISEDVAMLLAEASAMTSFAIIAAVDRASVASGRHLCKSGHSIFSVENGLTTQNHAAFGHRLAIRCGVRKLLLFDNTAFFLDGHDNAHVSLLYEQCWLTINIIQYLH
jgi:hypothetical protein